MSFNTLDQVDLRGQRVFIRCDLNVPLDASGRISDDTRIRASLGGIRHALSQGARVMVTSHLGRPKEGRLAPGESLAPVAKRLGELLGAPVALVSDWLDRPFDIAPGQVRCSRTAARTWARRPMPKPWRGAWRRCATCT